MNISNSFTPAEVRVIDQLLFRLRTGGDVKGLLKSPEVATVAAKFLKMRQRAEGGAQ